MPSLSTPSGASPYKVVRAGNGTDLKQTIASYCGEKPIFIPKGTYVVDDYMDTSRTGIIDGLGPENTIIKPLANLTANKGLFHIDPTDAPTDLVLRGFRIDMDGKTGDAIRCDHWGYDTVSDYLLSSIEHIRVEDVQAGYVAVLIQNPMYMSMNMIRVRTKGTGFKFLNDGTYAVAWGNCTFRHLDVVPRGNNVIGLEIDNQGHSNVCNLTHFDHYQWYSNNRSGCTGIKITGIPRVLFSIPSVEFGPGVATDPDNCKCVHLKDTVDVEFHNPYFFCAANAQATTIGLLLEETGGAGAGSQCLRNKLIGGRINIGGSGVSIDDDVTAPDDVGHENHAICTRIYQAPSITSFKYVRCPVWNGAAFAIQDTYA